MNQGLYFADMKQMRRLTVNPRFRSRFFSPQEIKFLMVKGFPDYMIGEMFCGKIAFKKAIGMGFLGCKLSEVSVLTDYSGAYYISLSGHTKSRAGSLGIENIMISCAHSKQMVMASVTLYDD